MTSYKKLRQRLQMKGIQTTQVGNPDNADIPYITNKRKIRFAPQIYRQKIQISEASNKLGL